MIEMTHEGLVGTKWWNGNEVHQVFYCDHGSWYALANTENGILDEDLYFENFEELVFTLENNWRPFV